MTPQKLKNSILQLAVQGKLVEQRAEEGTAEELYKKIQAEKQKLTAEKKIKKEKPLPEITAEEITFDIPESWKWVRLGEVLSISSGDGLTKREMSEKGEYPVYGGNGINGYHNNYNVSKKTLVIGRVGYYCGSTHITEDKAWITDNAFIATFDETNIDMKWLKYYIDYLNPRNKASSTAQPVISGKLIYPLLFPLPPLEEQKRIVAKIEELLPQIDRYEKAWSKLEEFNKRFPEDMQKSILQYAVQGKLVEQRAEEGTAEELYKKIQAEKQKLIAEKKIKKEKPLSEITAEEIPFDIPESWKWVRLGEVVQLNPKNSIDDEMTTSFIPMKLIDDGYRNNCSYEIKKWGDIKKGFTHFADGDIGVAKITPCFQNRKSVIFKKLENGYGAGTTEVSVLRILNNTLDGNYILWFLKSDYFIKNGIKSFTGTAGQQRIHKDYLSNCVFPLPPLEEQKRIVAKIEELLPLCEKLRK